MTFLRFSLCFMFYQILSCFCSVRKCDWVGGRTHLNPPRYIGSPKLREVIGAGDLPDTKGSESSWRLPSSPFLITLTLCQVLRVIGLKIDTVRACGWIDFRGGNMLFNSNFYFLDKIGPFCFFGQFLEYSWKRLSMYIFGNFEVTVTNCISGLVSG